MDVSSQPMGHPAYCQGTTCEDYEIFNFMGAFMDTSTWTKGDKVGDITRRVNALISLPQSQTGPILIFNKGETLDNIMQKATEWGAWVTESPSMIRL
jgi:hypothetical protein